MIEKLLLVEYHSLPSTQDEAKRLINIGQCQELTAVATSCQTKGRGRYTRIWDSSVGDLALSIVLKPQVDLQYYSQIAYIAALAVGNTLLSYKSDINLMYKWVNDVLVNNQKISGILLEKYKYNMLIVGIGINIMPKQTIQDLHATSTSEIELFAEYKSLLSRLLEQFMEVYWHWQQYGFVPIRHQWLSRAMNIGQNINIRFLDHFIRGQFLDIDINGNMLLSLDNGEIMVISAGELFEIS